MDWGDLKDMYNVEVANIHQTYCRDVPPDTVLAREDIATNLARAQRGRTNGPEQLCDDLSAAAPKQMARHLHPLYANMSLLQQ